MVSLCSRRGPRTQRVVSKSTHLATALWTVLSTGRLLLLRTRHAKLVQTSPPSTLVCHSLYQLCIETIILTQSQDDSVTVMTEKPSINIPEQEVEFENLGTTIEVIVNGTTTVAGSDFQLVQFHMHTPSEHHVNGEYHPLEVHMVHQVVGKFRRSPATSQQARSLTLCAQPTQLNSPW